MTKWGAWMNVIAGALLVIAPFALGYDTLSDVAMYEAVAVGLLIGGLALWSALSTAAPAYLDYIVAMLGGWSIVAPFVLGYHTTVEMARNTDIVVGIAVALIALASHFYVSPVSRQKVTA
jgi:SPW repeat